MVSLRRFEGMINFYTRFIPNCAALVAPLNDLLMHVALCKNDLLAWSTTTKKTISDAKLALSNATSLNLFKAHSHTALFVDASEISCVPRFNKKMKKEFSSPWNVFQKALPNHK